MNPQNVLPQDVQLDSNDYKKINHLANQRIIDRRYVPPPISSEPLPEFYRNATLDKFDDKVTKQIKET